jgi:hypothetical protein
VLDDLLVLLRGDSWKVGLLPVEEISQVERRTRDPYVMNQLTTFQLKLKEALGKS